MGGRGSAGRTAVAAPAAPRSLGDRVREAYDELGGKVGEELSLARLRDKLADVPRAELDAKLREMDRAREIQLEPEPNRKALTDRAKAAAIYLGGEDKHFIVFLRKRT